MSKLYTEEEIKRTFGFGMNKMKFDGFMNAMKPIQLPTDEEIEEEAKDKINISADCFGQYDFTNGKQDGFIDGAIWMRDKIQGGNK